MARRQVGRQRGMWRLRRKRGAVDTKGSRVGFQAASAGGSQPSRVASPETSVITRQDLEHDTYTSERSERLRDEALQETAGDVPMQT
jgi:hypothetical protein